MGSKFGKLSSGGLMSKHGRDRILFVVAASITLAMVIVFVVVANVKQNAPVKTAVEKTDPFEATSAVAGNAIPLLAPEKEVRAGTKLSEVKFKDVQWPRHQVPEDAIRNPAELSNLYARIDLPPGLPITRSATTIQVITTDSATLKLTQGNRAVSFEIDETSGLEGHALPGTHVDVVLTHSENGNLVSSIIVQNARVLSYGGDTSPGTGGSSRPIRMSRTITLDVATGDALKISTGRQMGRLGLLMRAPDDNKAADIDRIDRDNMNRNNTDRVVKPDCTRGKIKMGGKDFLLGCDGTMTPLSE